MLSFPFKFPLMLLKEVIICPDIPKFAPTLHVHCLLIHIINLCAPHGQQKGGVGCHYELAAKKPGRIPQKLKQLLLLVMFWYN